MDQISACSVANGKLVPVRLKYSQLKEQYLAIREEELDFDATSCICSADCSWDYFANDCV